MSIVGYSFLRASLLSFDKSRGDVHMGERGALDLTFIGAGNAFTNGQCHSGFVANNRVLFDAPPTTVYALARARIDIEQLDVILLSHFHGDHYFGMPFLFLAYQFAGAAGNPARQRTRDLTIVGPPGVEETVEKLAQLAFPYLLTVEGYPNKHPVDAGYRRRYVEMAPGDQVETNGLRIGAARMNHAEGSLPVALGYRVEIDGHTLAYTGDSAWCDELFTIGRGADVYVADANYPTGRNQIEHMSMDDIRELRAGLDARTTMVLTHMGHGDPPRDLARTFAATDLGRFTFP